MNVCSVNIRPSAKVKPPTAANLAHNAGMKVASYWLDKNPHLLQSQSFTNYQDINEVWNRWVADAEQRYYKTHKRKMRSDAIRIEEGLIVIGKDVADRDNVQKLNQLINAFVKRFEEDNNSEVLHWSIHNHEGKNEQDKNIHIHFLFSNVNNNGEMVRRKWSKNYMSKLQDDIYDCAKDIFQNIERATNYKEQGKQAPKHQHHRVFRAKQEKEDLKKQLKQLKEDYKKERELLKATGTATQKDYQELKKKYEQAKKRIQELQEEKELVDGEIAEIAEELNCDPFSEDIKQAIQKLKNELKKLKEAYAKGELYQREKNQNTGKYKEIFDEMVKRGKKHRNR